MSLLCKYRLRTFLLIVNLVVLEQVSAFAIRTTAKGAAEIPSTSSQQLVDQQILEPVEEKTGPPDLGKDDELQKNEIPTTVISLKTTKEISDSTTDETTTATVATHGSLSNSSSEAIVKEFTAKTVTNTTNGTSSTISLDSISIGSTAAIQAENQTSGKENVNILLTSTTITEPTQTLSLKSTEVQNKSFATTKSENHSISTTQLSNDSTITSGSKYEPDNSTQQNESINDISPSNVPISNTEAIKSTKFENMSSSSMPPISKSLSEVKLNNLSNSTTPYQNETKNGSQPISMSVNSEQFTTKSINTNKPQENFETSMSPESMATKTTDESVIPIQSDSKYENRNELKNSVSKSDLLQNASTSVTESFNKSEGSVESENQFKITNQYQSTTEINNSDLNTQTFDAKTSVMPQSDVANTLADLSYSTTNIDISQETTREELKQRTAMDNTSYSTNPVDIDDIVTTVTASDKSNESSSQTVANKNENTEIINNKSSVNNKEDNSTKNNDKLDSSEKHHKSRKDILENNPDSIKKTTPYGKKYTVIDRKRLNIKKVGTTTEKDEILLEAGSAQGHSGLFLEKALKGASDITSLQELKNDLLTSNNISKTERFKETYKPVVMNSSFAPLQATPETQTAGPVVVSSLRAGYLDFSSRSTTPAAASRSTEGNKDMGSASTASAETLTPDNITLNVKENSPTTSRMQTTPVPATKLNTNQTVTEITDKTYEVTSKRLDLAEDDMEEELMKEAALYNSRELDRDQNSGKNKFANTEKPTNRSDLSNQEDLAVQPISSERPRSSGIYTVSPNYKPLKKIEVQPPKSFVRDPDDNSWRNESLSSLGIVFKANNSSKPLTQVLKNKTETVLNGSLVNDSKEQLELRQRLEKIAEIRKSKKKRINQLGETIYSDYEENSAEGQKSSERTAIPNIEKVSTPGTKPFRGTLNYSTETTQNSYETTPPSFEFEFYKETSTTSKPVVDVFEQDDDPDYILPDIDLKKSLASGNKMQAQAPSGPELLQKEFRVTTTPRTEPRPSFPERKPTVQYFPPREKMTTVAVNDYDTEFHNLVNAYTIKVPAKENVDPPATVPTLQYTQNKYDHAPTSRQLAHPPQTPLDLPAPQPPRDRESFTYLPSPVTYNRGSYVIKHFRDFIHDVINSEESQTGQTDEPLQGVTVNNLPTTDYDYEDQFRRGVLSRFMENFNQNSERFKAEFPVLYNTTVVHSGGGEAQAESSAFMKRLYEDARAIQLAGRQDVEDPPCDRTVELSPAYELHYYVPEQEEKEQVQPKRAAMTSLYRVRL